MRKDAVALIEDLRKKPLSEQPPFYIDEMNQILKQYAPQFPQSISQDEMYYLCVALFNYGYLKGVRYQKRKDRKEGK